MTTNRDSDRWVKYHVRSIRPVSTLRKVRRADRATFIDYVALARWKDPFRGCLCDEDGTAWTRSQRAEMVGESVTTLKRTEEALEAAGLITFQASGAPHKDSRGRLHIVKYDQYQANGSASGNGRQRPETDAAASGNGCQLPNQHPETDATIPRDTASGNGCQQPERATGAGLCGDTTLEESASGNGCQASIDVNDVDVNDQSTCMHESLKQNVQRQLALAGVEGEVFNALWMGVCGSNVPHFESVVLDAAMIAAQWAIGRKQAGDTRITPQRVSEYFRKTLRSQSAEEADRDALVDDAERFFVQLVGVMPRDDPQQKRQWQKDLLAFKRDQDLWLFDRAISGEEKVVRRAEELGAWSDERMEQVRKLVLAAPEECS